MGSSVGRCARFDRARFDRDCFDRCESCEPCVLDANAVGVTLVLDSGGVSALAGQRARLAALRRRDHWPPVIPVAVLVESLTGDHRRDCQVNRLLALSQLRTLDETQSRQAAQLRTATGRASQISAVDALVIALAATVSDLIVLTSDPLDLTALADHAHEQITVLKA